MKCRSEWQRPATEVRISTSRGPGLGRLTSSITSGLFTSCRTAAFIVFSQSDFLCQACSLRCRNQIANLTHGRGSIAEQQFSDLVLHAIFREPERIVRCDAMIDHEPRQQKP